VAIWPLVRHFDASEFTASPGSAPIQLWPNAANALAFSSIATFAHYSQHEMTVDPGNMYRHQLLTASDYTGSQSPYHGYGMAPQLPTVDPRNGCRSEFPSGLWDSNGSMSDSDPATCDPTNWFYYGYRGSIGLNTDWGDPSWSTFLGPTAETSGTELPTPLAPTRTSCWTPGSFARPSCTPDPLADPTRIGDWPEIANTPLTRTMATRMRDFIQRYGREGPRSDTLGKAVVVNIFLWDCAERGVAFRVR